MNTYEQNLARTLNAVHMSPVDKIPFSYSGPAYVARRQGMLMKDFITDFPKATDTTIGFLRTHPGIDSIHSPILCPTALSTLWFSNVRVPGVELPDDDLWQVLEQEVMTENDYQKILDMGFAAWRNDFFKDKLNDPLAKMAPYMGYAPTSIQRLKDEVGIPVMNGFSTGTPFEGFCGGRQLMNFFIDLMDEHDLVKAALDAAFDHQLGEYAAQLDAVRPLGAWVGGWRAAPELMSHDIFMEFIWPYLKKLIEVTIEKGVIPVLHFDSCWDREIETLKELPPRKCLLMLDGSTDMRRARDILDDRMCLMGDVPASILAFGSADECYSYTRKLISDVGPKTGLIISSGCDCPLNAVDENVDAIIQATLNFQI